MQPKKRALGRGLEALLPPKKPELIPTDDLPSVAIADDPTRKTTLPITAIRRNEAQPREFFDDGRLDELADSIRRYGIIQPLAVMPRGHDYMIVAGERRFRAAQLAGITEVPVVIMPDLSRQEILEFALVENLQREDLNALEEAKAYKSLQSTFSLTAEEIATHVGKSRSTIANSLRLLSLSPDMQEDLQSERITAGHARAIMSLEDRRDQELLRNQILTENLSVRQAELKARTMMDAGASRTGKGRATVPKRKAPQDDTIRRLRDQLVETLACRVSVSSPDGARGKIEIFFDSLDDLQTLLDQLEIDL